MADGGMILNIDLDNLPAIAPQVKFKGGQWRDRKQAQRDYKKKHQLAGGEPADSAAAAKKTDGRGRQPKRPRADGADDERPTKRGTGGGIGGQQRWQPSEGRVVGAGGEGGSSGGGGGGGGGGSGGGGGGAPGGRPQNGVTSRLFTSNPEHITDLEAEAAAATASTDEPVKPSNAPLSDEASTFLALGLSRRIARQLSEFMGLKAPTAIQRNAITQLVAHDHDAFLQAETGSGKTLAYLLPIVQRLIALSEDNDGVRRPTKLSRGGLGLFAVILAPTRELCTQIAAVLDKLLGCAPFLHATTVVGGENKKAEKARLRKGVNILVATPGRLTDHLDNTDVLDVSRVRWLVLDEGDRLMEMGFEKDIRAVVSKIRQGGKAVEMLTTTKDGQPIPKGVLPARRVTVLCSATMKMNTIKLGELTLEDAVHIKSTGGEAEAKPNATAVASLAAEASGEAASDSSAIFDAPAQLKQTYAIVPAKLRLVTLIGLLRSTFARKNSVMKAIIFLSCGDSVDYHFDLLRAFDDDGKPVPYTAPTLAAKEAASAGDKAEDAAADGEDSDAKSDAESGVESDADTDEDDKAAEKKRSAEKRASAKAASISSTVAPAAYITSPANRTVVLHKLHGSLEQAVRKATLASFRDETNHPTLLITTDIASRGLDVPSVDLVIEYDPAMAVEDHMHRIGRTARAGRAGSSTLFIQPGSEEGYIPFLKSKSSATSQSVLTSQLYDAVLKRGYAAPVDLPEAFTVAGKGNKKSVEWAGSNSNYEVVAEHDPSLPQQSWTKRAEALQLHIEQRLIRSAALAAAAAAAADHGKGHGWPAKKWSKKDKNDKNDKKGKKGGPPTTAIGPNLLDAARQAFRSHIRAYATHTHEERVFFDITRLHLGHMAKSFGLREAPGNMGGGSIQRLTKRTAASNKSRGRGNTYSNGAANAGRATTSVSRRSGHDSDDDDFGSRSKAVDEEAARRMQARMRDMMSNPAAEFNIG